LPLRRGAAPAPSGMSSPTAPLLEGHKHRKKEKPPPKCESTAHTPGECHGFETQRRDASWFVLHDAQLDIGDSCGPAGGAAKRLRRKTMVALASSAGATGMLMALELFFGWWLESLALLSDGVHQLSDVALYLGLLWAVVLSGKTADAASYSFGYDRAQVLGALIALLLQYFATGLLISMAFERLVVAPRPVDGRGVCAVGACSLFTNMFLLGCLPVADGGHGHSHGGGQGHSNGEGGMAMNVARLHMLGDLVQGGAVIVAGAVSWAMPACTWADPTSAFVYAAVVLMTTWGTLKGLLEVLMERAPLELNATKMFEELGRIKGVIDTHCCHVWMLAPGKVAMSAHIHVEDDMHEDVLHAAQILVRHKYGIIHSTLQISDDDDLA